MQSIDDCTALGGSNKPLTDRISTTTTMTKPVSYPVKIHHQGHTATIHVKENEPILQALEHQSSSPNNLGLSNIPHECRRGNCMTCASRLVSDTEDSLRANINNGLSPTVASELGKEGFILTCCSDITGPGVSLEIEQNDELWGKVYRSRFNDAEELGMEARARLMRRVDEENVAKWKRRMEMAWDSSGDGGDTIDKGMR
jgi:ferredoxin